MGSCGSKGVAVGNEQHGTTDSAACRPSSAGSPNTGGQLRTVAKTAWQTSARNLMKSLSQRRQGSYRQRSSSARKDALTDVDDEEVDSAGRGGRLGGRNRSKPLPSPAQASASAVAWQPSNADPGQKSGQRGHHLTDTAKVEVASCMEVVAEDAEAGDSCVRSFHVRNQATDSMDETEGNEDQPRKESRQLSPDGSQRRRKAAGASCSSGSGAMSPFSVTSPTSDGADSDMWPVGGPSRIPRSSNPAEADGTILSTSPRAAGAAGRLPPADGGGWTAPPPPAAAAPAAVPTVASTPPGPQPATAVAIPATEAAVAPAPAMGCGADADQAPAVPAPSAPTATAGPSETVQWVIRPGPPVESAYVLGDVLGKGSFGVVRAATHIASGAKVAVKTIRKSLLAADDVSALRREVEILHHLSGHPHISQLLGVYEEPSQLHLVLELYQGGDLFDAIISVGRHSERAAADVLRTVLTAISYCHAMGVAHRDIKPENFMLTAPLHPLVAEAAAAAASGGGGGSGGGQEQSEGLVPSAGGGGGGGDDGSLGSKLKLIDFGLSVFCTDSQPLTDTVGTSYYVAPEVLARSYSRSADVWSAGVILHILLTGYAPFDGRNDQEILRSVQAGKLDLTTDPIWQSISREATAVLTAMLNRDPAQRATADQLLATPWLGRTASSCTASASPLPGVVSERMRRFARMNSFKKEARRVVASLMRPEEVAGLVAQFKALDADGDGKLNVQELRDGLARQELQSRFPLAAAGAGPLREDELRELVNRSDLNGDGLLDQSEFLGAALPTAVIARQAQQALAAAALARPGSRVGTGTAAAANTPLAAAFAHFDADGSGFITPDELRSALAAHHPESQGPDIGALLSRVDRDADGRISYPEFVEMLVQEIDDQDELYDNGGGGGPADVAVAGSKGWGAGGGVKSHTDGMAAGQGGRAHGPRQPQAQAKAQRHRAGQNMMAAYPPDTVSTAQQQQQLQQQRRDGVRGRGGGANAKRRMQIPAAWGVGLPPPPQQQQQQQLPPPSSQAGRSRNGQIPSTSFMSAAAVQSGSGRLSSFDWFDECNSRGGGETSAGEMGDDDGGWMRGEAPVPTAAAASAAAASGGNARKGPGPGTQVNGGGSGGYTPSRLSPAPPAAVHAGLYRAAEAAALTLMAGGPEGESSLLGQMSMGLSGASAVPGGGSGAVRVGASGRGPAGAAANPGYTCNRPPALVIPQQPVAARRARRHSAAETLGSGYGYGCGYTVSGGGATAAAAAADVVDGPFSNFPTSRADRAPRMSEGHALSAHHNHHTGAVNGPRQHAMLHPGNAAARGPPGTGGGGVGPSPLGGPRARNRQMMYGMDEQLSSSGVSPSQRGGHPRGDPIASNNAGQHLRGRLGGGGGGGGGGDVSAPIEHLVSPFAGAAATGGAGGFRPRGGVLQPQPPLGPRALSPMAAACRQPMDLYGNPGGSRSVPHNRRVADGGYSDQPLAQLRIHGGGAGGGVIALQHEAAVLPPGACAEDYFPLSPTVAASQHGRMVAATSHHRRSLPSGLPADLHQHEHHFQYQLQLQQQQQQQPLAPFAPQAGSHRGGGGGGGGGGNGVYSEPLPSISGAMGRRSGAGNSPERGDGLVLRGLMPSWEEEEELS